MADLRTQILDVRPPAQLFHFHAVFGKIWLNNRFPLVGNLRFFTGLALKMDVIHFGK